MRVNHGSRWLQNLGPSKNTPEANETDDSISEQTADMSIDVAYEAQDCGPVGAVVCTPRCANNDPKSTASEVSSIRIMTTNGYKFRRSSEG